MDTNVVILITSLVSAVLTGVLVSAANHYWNRRYLMAVEREKYRQTIFRIKIKIFNEIALAIHTSILFTADTVSRGKLDTVADIHQKLSAIYLKALDVYTVIHKNMLYIPEEALDRISAAMKELSPDKGVVSAEKFKAIIEAVNDTLWKIMDLLRDDLGIENFGQTLK
jgi:hypothetical protein